MRKPQTRWIALAGAAAVSLAAFGAIAAPAAAGDQPSQPQLFDQQNKSTYLIDGFQVAYVAPGLERYGIVSESRSDRRGNRTSHLAWVRGQGEAVHGKASVFRASKFTDLDTVYEERYSDLDPKKLEKVEINDNQGYLSAATGEVFWLDQEGVAIAVFLEPDRWGSKELLAMARGVVTHSKKVPFTPTGVWGVAKDENSAGITPSVVRESLISMEGATAASSKLKSAASPASSAEEDELTDEQVKAIKNCLIGEVGTMPGAIWDQNIEFSPGSSVTWNSGLWNLVQEPIRDAAITKCSERLGVKESQVREVLEDLAASPRPSQGSTGNPSTEHQNLWNQTSWL